MEWGFMVLAVACAVFLVQILMDYNRQSNDLRPQIYRVENEVKGQGEEQEKHLKMSDDLRVRIAQISGEVAEMEARRTEMEKNLRARQAEDGEKPKHASS